MDSRGLSWGARLWRAFRALLFFALLLTLGAAALYALSVVNSRTYALAVEHGQLVVMKGRLLPTGAEPWAPREAQLAEAYAPVDLAGSPPPALAGRTFDDRDQLDRALFDVLEGLARPRLTSDEPAALDQALAYVRRGERLTGVTADQRRALKRMQQELAFRLAQDRLDDARQKLEEALEQLRLAAQSDSRHKRDASFLLWAVEPQVQLLATTLRAAAAGRPGGSAGKGTDLGATFSGPLRACLDALQHPPGTDDVPATANPPAP